MRPHFSERFIRSYSSAPPAIQWAFDRHYPTPEVAYEPHPLPLIARMDTLKRLFIKTLFNPYKSTIVAVIRALDPSIALWSRKGREFFGATQHQLTIVSLDADFDRTERGRKRPTETLQG